MEKKWYYCWDMIDCGWLGFGPFGDFVHFLLLINPSFF